MTDKRPSGHLGDAWIEIDKTDDPRFFVGFLDATRAAALDYARQYPDAAFAHLALKPGLSVLDCGCGTGELLSIIAGQIAPGEACGGDLSSVMVEEARQRMAATKLTNLRFETLDVQALAIPDESFDRVLATHLLVHVPDPRQAIHEMYRVTRRDGLVVIADMDWDSFVIGCSNKEIGRRFTQLFCDGLRNGLVAREYAGWMKAEGFANIQVTAQAARFEDFVLMNDWIVKPSLRHFVANGTMSAVEAQSLSDDLADRHVRGHFFAASTYYTVIGQRI